MPVPESQEESVYDRVQATPFSPLDPEAVQPTSSRPAPSSDDAPDFGGTSGEDGDAGDSGPQAQDEEAPAQFDERWREPFHGLLYLGALTKSFTLWGHDFVVRTLTTEEIARIALLVKPYAGTLVENAVYQSAVVAASVVTVDGQPLPQSIERGDDGLETVRFPYVMRKWQPPVREKVFEEYFSLEVESRKVLEQMGNASG